MARLGPYSRPLALAKLDCRTREATLLRQTREALIAHVGGAPSATQIALIERCAMLRLHLQLLDEKTLKAGGAMTEHDAKTYLAWTGAYTRLMRQLGLTAQAGKAPSLSDYLAEAAE